MARKNCRILDTSDVFPVITMHAVDGGTIVLPMNFEGKWGILFFYRGSW